MGRRLARGAMALGSVLVLAVAIELVCRVATPFPPHVQRTYRQDSRFLYFHAPHSRGHEISPFGEFPPVLLRYDAHGFRGPDMVPDRNDGCDVYVLGDSFVEGRQVAEEDTLPMQLAKSLQCGARPARVFNAGCSGYTTTTAFLLWKHLIAPRSPAAVVYLFSFNDYCDNFWYNNYSAHPDIFDAPPPAALMPAAYAATPFSPRQWLMTNLASVSAARRLYASLADAPPAIREWKELTSSRSFTSNWTLINKTALDADERHLLDFTHEGLVRMQRLAREHGARFLVAVLPLPMQAGPRQWRHGKASVGFAESEAMNSRAYQDRLLAFLRNSSIPAVDLLPAFIEADRRGGRLFYDYDGHLTPEGLAVAAGTIRLALRELLDRPPSRDE